MTIFCVEKKCHQNKFKQRCEEYACEKTLPKYKMKLILIIFLKASMRAFFLYSDFPAMKFNFLSYYLLTTMLNSIDDDNDSLNKAAKTSTTPAQSKSPSTAMAKTSNSIKIKTNCCFILICPFFYSICS